MKKKKPFVYSPKRWQELQESSDPLTRDILALAKRYDISQVINRVHQIYNLIFVPAPAKTVGRKPKWSNDNLLWPWVAAEVELALERRANPKATMLTCMEKKFKNLKGEPLRVLYHLSDDKHLEIANFRTAVRLHSKGKKLLKTDPKTTAGWQEFRDYVVAAETSKK
jgi:hypothetical protein